MMTFFPQRSPNARRAAQEIPAAAFLPYACHYDDATLLTKTGELLQCLRLEGFPFECSGDFEIQMKKRLRNVLLKSVAGGEYALWFHTLRQRQTAYPGGTFVPGFADWLDQKWKTKNKSQKLFTNELYITLVRKGPGQAAGLSSWIEKVSRTRDEGQRRLYFTRAAQELSDITRRFETTLSEYRPRLLKRVTDKGRTTSEVLRFLARLINLEDRAIMDPQMDLSRYLSYKRHFFGAHALECRGASGSKYAAALSIKEYGAETWPGMLDGFYQLPFEFILSQSFVFRSRQEALSRMQLQQRRLLQSEDLSTTQTDEIDEALDQTTAGALAFGEHHLTVFPVVDRIEDLDDAVAAVDGELVNLGILSVREDLNLEAAFWAQLPGNFDFIARRSLISTMNLAGLASLHNHPSGRLAGNLWGPAVTVLETSSGTPYYFNFHAGDVGHTTLIGPTGCGKTSVLNFLCAQARKFNARLYYFDRNRGGEIFIRAMNGSYSILGPAYASGFNPLKLADTPSNRRFLVEWLESLVTSGGETLTPEDQAKICDAVEGNYKLRVEDRRLESVAPFLGLAGPGRLGSRLRAWYGSGARASLFGGDQDVLTLDQSVMGFEMGEILSDPESLAPVLLYLFHRIQSVLDGTPTIVVLDEAWALFSNPIFSSKLEDWLKTFRKLNALIIFATQSVEDAAKSPISTTLIGQTATHIFFPNPKAGEEYRTVFHLSERECELLRETLDKESRYFLVKQASDSVVARVDLSHFKDALSVLSGRAETVKQVDALRKLYGDPPDRWLPHFLEGSYESMERR